MTTKVLLARCAADCELPKGWGLWIKGRLVATYRYVGWSYPLSKRCVTFFVLKSRYIGTGAEEPMLLLVLNQHSLFFLLFSRILGTKERSKPARTYPRLNDPVGQGSVRAGKRTGKSECLPADRQVIR